MKVYRFIVVLMLMASCSPTPPKPAPPPVRVEVAHAEVKDIPLYVEAIGNVYEYSIVQIRPQVQGILLNAYASQGDFVKAGDLLYEIDSRSYKAILDQAKAALVKDQAAVEIAQSTLKRYGELVNKDFISKLTYEQYQTNLASAEAQVAIDKAAIESAQINFDYCKIFSPIEGKLSVFNIYPGNLVTVNDPNALTEIRQINPIEVRFSIPQRDFQELQKIQSSNNLKFEAFLPFEDNRKFEGEVFFVDNHVDLSTGTILIKGIIPNQEKILWPGEFVRVKVLLKMMPNTVVIPFAAIQTGQEGDYVYVVDAEMTAKAVKVTVGEKIDDAIAIYSGLNANDVVVTNGQLNLGSGSKVIIVQPNEGLGTQ